MGGLWREFTCGAFEIDGIYVNWYALQVGCRKEISISTQIERRGVECFVPKYKNFREWSDRVKEVEQALFPGYLFCRLHLDDRQQVLSAAGVIRLVGNGRIATAVPDAEIEALQLAGKFEEASEPWPYIKTGERVRIHQGQLAGIQGILIKFKGNHRVVLSVTLLQRSVALEVDLSWVTALNSERPHTDPSAVQIMAASSI